MSLFDLQHRDQLQSTNPQVAINATLNELEGLAHRISAWALVEHNEDGTHNVVPSGFAFVPVGALMMWSTASAPSKWLICDGSQRSRTTYQGLFNVIGTTYGAGDGSTTFNLPDLRQRFPLGKAASGTGSTLGSTGGAINHTHTTSGLTTSVAGSHNHGGSTGSHFHGLSQLGSAATSTAGVSTVTYADGPNTLIYAVGGHAHFTVTPGAIPFPTSDNSTASVSADGNHSHSVSGGATDTNNPPYTVINYIILAGI